MQMHESKPLSNWLYRFGAKLIDLAFAFAVILLLGWLLLIVALLIRLESKGPVLFIQDRVGRHGATFKCLKFRSMKVGTVQAGTHEVGQDRLTGMGKFIRETKLDEFPQVWNILRGEMSLVGPRPCLPVQEELIAERKKRGVLDVLPGITGYAQVRQIDMSTPELLARTDAEYIALRTLPLDLKIIYQTFLGRGGGDKTR